MKYPIFLVLLQVVCALSQGCQDTACSNLYPGSMCVSESDAAAWPIPCRPNTATAPLCTPNITTTDCYWTNWINNDSPTGRGDYEAAPEGCNIDMYEVQLVEGGPIYTNVLDITFNVLQDDSYVYCRNADQPFCPVNSNGYPNPYNEDECCLNWRVRYHCCPPAPPCYCCPDPNVSNECEDQGCKDHFGGQGECYDVTKANWQEINQEVYLGQSAPANLSLCNPSLDESCCRCFKKKACQDSGCSQAFDGQGVCINLMEDDLTEFNLDLTVPQDPEPNLCRNDLTKDCCSCFKKLKPADQGSSCYKVPCQVNGTDGFCVGNGDPLPNGDYIQTEFRCTEGLDQEECFCWIEMEPPIPCREKKCEYQGQDGVCQDVNETTPPSDSYTVPTFMPCDDTQECHCWVSCAGSICEFEGKQGKCLNPTDPIPKGMNFTGTYCDEYETCECWVEEESVDCDQGCIHEGNTGLCYGPNDLIPEGLVPTTTFCDTAEQCQCYISERPCINEPCEHGTQTGVCYGRNDIVPKGLIITDTLCDSTEPRCFCFVQEEEPESCTDFPCEHNGQEGKCYGVDDPIPKGMQPTNTPCGSTDLDCRCYVENIDEPCTGMDCKVQGFPGTCYKPNGPFPNDYKNSFVPCNEDGFTDECTCWLFCGNNWSDNKCKKNKNKCNKSNVFKNCMKTCGKCDDIIAPPA